jgi:eukaryotic-like serine/threonine-protein kinase
VLGHLGRVSDEPDLSATKYELVRKLGRGGMGVVYEAVDTELQRGVAIKVSSSLPSSPELDERLRREARIVARLEHPGIVPVHDVGSLPDGRVFYVMKLVCGERLDAWARGRHERPAMLRLFQRICDAVAFAHARGVLHRDLKPENVMVGAFGEALVMDWGIAAELAASSSQDADGSAIGTRGYMSPEQARGEIVSLDERTDVYGLGAILRLLVSHAGPVPKPLASICAKATAGDRANRYASAQELAEDVGRFLDAEPVRSHRESAAERAVRFVSRHRVVLSLLGAYVVLRLLLIGLSR